MPELYQLYVANNRTGDFLLSMSRNRTDSPLNRKLLEHWYGKANIDPSEALHDYKYKSIPLYLPTLEGQISGKPSPLDRPFLRGDYKEFYYYNGTASDMMKAVMITDTGK